MLTAVRTSKNNESISLSLKQNVYAVLSKTLLHQTFSETAASER